MTTTMDFSEASKEQKNAATSPRLKARPKPRGFHNAAHMLLLLMSALIQTSHTFDLVGMELKPTTVQYDGASLDFWAIPEQAIPSGGFVKLKVPSDIVTKTTGFGCKNVMKDRDCVVTHSRNQFTIEVDYDIADGEQFQFRITNAIINPDSSKPSGTFSVSTSTGELENSSPVMKIQATTGTMETYNLQPESEIVGESTTLVVELSTEHDIPADADILMIFPMWNSQNPVTDQQKPFIQGNVACEAGTDLNPDLICIFNNEKNRLIVRKATKIRIPRGRVVSFSVSGFKNPIEATFADGFEIKTAIQSDDEECYEGEYCLIDEAVGSISKVSAAARLQSPTLQPIDTLSETSGMIQEVNSMQLDFFLPVPLNPGCQIEIILPEQYSVDDVVYLISKNAFGKFNTYREDLGNLYVNVDKRSLKLSGACPYYVANNNVATIEVYSLRQPNYEKPTDSLTIIITSATDALIARVDEGVTFIPERGALLVETDALIKTVQEPTMVTFELIPQHAIYVSDNPQIVIEFPPEINVDTRVCEIQDVRMDGYDGVIARECWVNDQIFEVKQFLPYDYIPAEEGEPPKKIYFTLGLVINSDSVQPVTGLNVLIQAEELYAIDEFEGPVGWTAVTGSFSNTKVTFSESVAYAADVTYTISFTPDHKVPQNGYIEIDFPKQVSVPDYSFSQSSCRAISTSAFGSNQITCEFVDASNLSDPYRLRDPNTPSHYTMRIENAFRRTSVEGEKEFSLEIPGLRNPIQTVPTNSFKFRTFDQLGRPIDELNDGTTISMDQPSDLEIVLVTLQSYTNADKNSYTVTLVPTVPVWEINLVLITFPDQITLPESSVDLNCESLFTSLLADVQCTYLSDASDVPSNLDYKPEKTVRVALTFPSGVEQIDPLDRFSITMEDIINPTTTQTTDSFQVRITDGNYIEINSKLKEITVTTNNAAKVVEVARPTTLPMPGVEAPFNLDFFPEHAIAPGGGILVVYPPETLINKLQTLTAEVTVDNLEVDQDLLVLEADISARALRILNLVQNGVPYVPAPGAKISVKLIGLRTPYQSDETKSFVMTTFNFIEGKYYFIDTVTSGMTFNSKCNFPCKDCPANDPGKCLSCYSLEDLQDEDGELDSNADLRPFLQVDTCVEKCAADRYYDATTDRCEQCDPTCLKCTERADKCTKCGIDEFLFLHQDQCLTSCPDQFIEDPTANKCKSCQGNCLTCEGLPTSCTSCDTNSAYKFFFQESCIDECIPDISVQVGDECVQCDSTCKTCSGTPQTCTSCESHMKLDPFNQKCEDKCEAEVQVYNEVTQKCEFCDDKCTKCAGSTSTCTACKPGYVLNFDQTCQETCGAENQTPIDGICAACEEPCYTCEGSLSTCKTCIDSYALYLGTKCVQYCPIKYENKDDVCVYEGLVCPAGFELNQSKDGCIPLTFDCQPGYQINKEETACVPKPGSAVPFPFLLCAMLLTLLVLGSYLKDKLFTKVVTNLIACIGSLELIMYGMMAAYAYSLDEILILMFIGIGFFGLLASNILFVSYFRQQIIAKDQKFVKWLHFFPKTRFWLPIISLLLNFKMGKMFYSGFYGLESAQAVFGFPKKFFYLQRMTAYFSFIFCYAFIFIADALILIKIEWGYQLVILAIETIVLQLIIIILTCIEFRKGATKLLHQPEQLSMFKPQFKGGRNQFKVMGGIEDDDDYQAGIPDIDEDTLIRSKIKTETLEIGLRQKALARILNQVGKQPTEKGVDIKDCLTKFDPDRIKMRRCFSMSNLGSDDGSWKAEGEDSDDPNGPLKVQQLTTPGENLDAFEAEEPRARRYSFPLSPKRKETLPNTLIFERAISDIKEANKDFLIDNVYTDTKPVLDPFSKRKVKTVSRRTQTYLRELLQVDGEEVHESDMEVLMEEEAEIDFDFAKGLINKVIDYISSADESAPVQEKKKKVVKKVFKPKKEIPDFELADIMGDFEIDDMGNFIIMRGDGGELLDQRERLVNRRGYLIDRFGNVINNLGNIIFKAIELDVDDEIPAPFGFEKRKKNLLKLGDENQFKVESYRQSIQTGDHQASQLNMDDEDLLDKEVTAIKEQSKQKQQSQDASPKAQSQAQDDEGYLGVGQNMNLSIKDGQPSQMDNDVIDEEDNLEAEIDQLVQKKVPKKRKVLKGAKVNKKLNNMPPKRIKPEDVRGLFPHLSIENDEQRRLAKIAGSISGLANQLADKQRQQQLVDDRKHSAAAHSQQLDWNTLQDDQKLERIRQEQLNELMIGSEIAATEKFGHDLVRDQSLLMQDRPNSNFGGITRQMSAIARPQRDSDAGLRRHRSSNKPIGHMRDRTDDLHRVYGQAADLTGIPDDTQDLMMPRGVPEGAFQTADRAFRPRRGQSGRPEGRMAGLETIYMTKVPKLKPAMNMNVTSQSGLNLNKRNFSASRRHDQHKAFRPTLDRFADDPSQLNVNTTMQYGGLPHGGGRDILEMAEQLDQMQRDYMSHNRGGISTQKITHAPLASQPHLFDETGRDLHVPEGNVSGVQSHYPQQPNYPGLQGMSRTASGQQRFAPNSEANMSMDGAQQNNWVADQ